MIAMMMVMMMMMMMNRLIDLGGLCFHTPLERERARERISSLSQTLKKGGNNKNKKKKKKKKQLKESVNP